MRVAQELTILLMFAVMVAVAEDVSHQKSAVVACPQDHDCGNGVCMAPIISEPSYLICQCDRGYTTVTSPCDQELKSQLAAFLVSFFLGMTGADWFYLSNHSTYYIGIGALKFMLIGLAGFVTYYYMMGFLLIFQTLADPSSVTSRKKIGVGFYVALLVVLMLWWLIDWMRVLTGHFKDGSGQDLISFSF